MTMPPAASAGPPGHPESTRPAWAYPPPGAALYAGAAPYPGAAAPYPGPAPYSGPTRHPGPVPYPGPAPYPGAAPYPGYPDGAVVFAPPPEYAQPGGRELAPATDRLLARIIDSLIIAIPVLIMEIPIIVLAWIWLTDTIELTAPADPTAPALTPTDSDLLLAFAVVLAALALVVLLSTLVTYLYEVTFMHRTGQTIGKRMMKIQVVRIEDGGPIASRHARRRWLARGGVATLALIPLVGSIIGIYNWLDSLWLLWDKPNRQCLHDKYGQTTVVKLTAADPAPPTGELARAAA